MSVISNPPIEALPEEVRHLAKLTIEMIKKNKAAPAAAAVVPAVKAKRKAKAKAAAPGAVAAKAAAWAKGPPRGAAGAVEAAKLSPCLTASRHAAGPRAAAGEKKPKEKHSWCSSSFVDCWILQFFMQLI